MLSVLALAALAPTTMVGIGYQTWFPPQDWSKSWDVPLLGRYRSDDEKVIRQHADWLTDAGVDFVWIDWSNNIDAGESRPDLLSIEASTRKLFDVYAGLQRKPKISIFLGIDGKPENVTNGKLRAKANQIFREFVVVGKYRELLVDYLGKPLLTIYVGTPSPFQDSTPLWDDPRFTVRWMTGFIADQPELRQGRRSRYGYWSWWERSPQTVASHEGQPEAVTVSAAFPGPKGWETKEAKGRRAGLTFAEQWQRARSLKPRFVLVNSWNEWVPGEEHNGELSNDLEPSQRWGDRYLKLLKAEISKYRSGR